MQIKNLLIITITSLSLTTVANAGVFNIGFNSPSNTQINRIDLSDESREKVKGFDLGFNSPAHTKASRVKLSAKQLAKVQQKNTVSKGFSLGSNS